MTNYEKIKSMSIDEMAKIIIPYITCVMCDRPDMCCLWRCKLTVKKWLEKEYKKEHNTNDMCESEVKQKIEMIKQGKLPLIPSVDNQSTKGLVTSDTYDSEAKRIIKRMSR